MAEQFNDDKTEKPSPHKLRKAREQGQVVRSRDLATAAGLVAALKLLLVLTPLYLQDFRALFAYAFVPLDGEGMLESTLAVAFSDAWRLLVQMVLPLLVVPALVIVISLVPGGWVFNTTHWQPKPSRLNPLANLARLFAARHAGDLLMTLGKALALCAVLWSIVGTSTADFLRLQNQTLDHALLHGASLLADGVLALALVLVLFGVVDGFLQRFLFLRGQRMSQRELKEELKTQEGRPEVRQRIRQLQRQLARRGVRKSVPTADVVIANPEHYAVALKYDEQRAQAPFVVAKGVDEMALYIREVAAEHKVEVLVLPPLARAIYHTSQVNQQIPAALYRAVAQVLTYVLQLKAFTAGRRGARPVLPADIVVPKELRTP
jgi:flagellar biosynthetic protein FlhB